MTKQEKMFVVIGLLLLLGFLFINRRKGTPTGNGSWPSEVQRQVEH